MGDSTHSIDFFDIDTRELIHEISSARSQPGDGHSGDVNAIALSNDNCFLATGSDDHYIKIWNVKSQSKDLLGTLGGHTKAVYSLVYTLDDKKLISSGADGIINVWSTSELKSIHQITYESAINSVALIPDSEIFLTAGQDGRVVFWTSCLSRAGSFFAHSQEIMSASVDLKGNFIATGGKDGQIKIWQFHLTDVENGMHPFLKHEISIGNSVDAISISPEGNLVASIDNAGNVYQHRLETGELVYKTNEKPAFGFNRTHAIKFSRNGRILVAGVKNNVRIWKQVI